MSIRRMWRQKMGKFGKFKISKDKKGEYRWKLLAANGRVIAVSEGYVTKRNCVDGIRSVKHNVPYARIMEEK